MMHLICIRCWCTIWHRCDMRLLLSRCMCIAAFMLHRFKMINLSINRWFFKIIICGWFFWQRCFCIGINVTICPCSSIICSNNGCCRCTLFTKWRWTGSIICCIIISCYWQFRIMELIVWLMSLRLRWSLNGRNVRRKGKHNKIDNFLFEYWAKRQW